MSAAYRRMKAAWKAYEERTMIELKRDKPGLKMSQYRDMIWKVSLHMQQNRPHVIRTSVFTDPSRCKTSFSSLLSVRNQLMWRVLTIFLCLHNSRTASTCGPSILYMP